MLTDNETQFINNAIHTHIKELGLPVAEMGAHVVRKLQIMRQNQPLAPPAPATEDKEEINAAETED